MAKECEVCGKTTGLRLLADRLLCKEHASALLRRKCAAVMTSSGSPRVRGKARCQNDAFGDDLLCASHNRAGAEVQEWELCPTCRKVERIVGGMCPRCDT